MCSKRLITVLKELREICSAVNYFISSTYLNDMTHSIKACMSKALYSSIKKCKNMSNVGKNHIEQSHSLQIFNIA